MSEKYKVRNESGEEFDVAKDNLEKAEADGYLPVVSDGKSELRTRSSNFEKAASDGFKPIYSGMNELNKPEKLKPTGDQKELTSFVPDVPIFTPLISKAGAALESGEFGGKKYDETLDRYKKNIKESNEAYPVASQATSIAGSMALPVWGTGSKIKSGVDAAAAFGKRMISGAGLTVADSALRDQDLDIIGAVENQLLYGELPIEGVKKIGQGYSRFMAGIPKKTRDKYVERRGEIKDDSVEQLSTDIDEMTGRYRDEVSDYKEVSKRIINDLRLKKPDEGLVGEVVDSLKKIRQMTSEQSSKAFKVLEDTKQKAMVLPIKNHLRDVLEDLKIAGVERQSEAIPALKKQAEWLNKIKQNEISYTDLKAYIQDLDESIEGSYAKLKTPGGYLNKGDRALINYRAWIDQNYLKQIPEYAQIMEPLRDLTDVSKRAVDLISDERTAYNTLKNIHKPENKQYRQTISQLGKYTGKDFDNRISEYARAKELIDDPVKLQAYLKELPTHKKNLEDLKKAARITPATSEGFVRKIGREKGSLDAKDRAELIKYLETSRLGKDASEDALRKIDIPRRAENVGIKEYMESPFVQGSRNVNAATASVRGLASALGMNSEAGGGIGAVIGLATDLVGRQVVKKALDIMADNPNGMRLIEKSARRGAQSLALTMSMIARADKEQLQQMGLENEQP